MEHCLYYYAEILDATLNCKKKIIKMQQILPQCSIKIVVKIVFIASLRLFYEMILTVLFK